MKACAIKYETFDSIPLQEHLDEVRRLENQITFLQDVIQRGAKEALEMRRVAG